MVSDVRPLTAYQHPLRSGTEKIMSVKLPVAPITLTALPRWLTWLTSFTYLCFALYMTLNLTTPSWRYGPFAWLPLFHLHEWMGAPVAVGVFNLLPLIIVAGWGVTLWGRWHFHRRPFNFGQWHLTLPFLLFTSWGMFSLDLAPTRRTFLQGMGLALAWLVYLYAINEKRDWSRPLLIILVGQSLVALAQFFHQADMGLVGLGELPLNPAFSGITVLGARGTRWLRAYGLTTHPNQLGALLTALLLILIPAWIKVGCKLNSHRITFFYTLAIGLGLGGLYVSFSRSAWLALAGGLFVLGAAAFYQRPRFSLPPKTFLYHLAAALLPLLCLVLFYGDLALSRFINLEQSLEATSIHDRVDAVGLARQVIELNWKTGVGLGNYYDYAKGLDAAAFTVHNIPLLMFAELGLPGLLLWFWFALTPFLAIFPLSILRRITLSPHLPFTLSPPHLVNLSQLAPWVAMLIIGLFDVTLWLTTHWQTAILFGLFLAHLNHPLSVPALIAAKT